MRVLLRWLPALAVFATIYWFSDQPTWPDAMVGQPDWLLHGAAYALLGVTICFGLGGPLRRPLSLRRVGLAWLLVIVAGGFDEIHQSFIEGRDAAVMDVVADAVGGLAGLLVAQWAAFAGKRTSWEHPRS